MEPPDGEMERPAPETDPHETDPHDSATQAMAFAPALAREEADGGLPPAGRAWHQEMPRWLATLDSERTRHEYQKAAGYFFRTAGVPEMLEQLTFDLLLAYRGSLALRAERQPSPAAPTAASASPPMRGGTARVQGSGHAMLDTAQAGDGTWTNANPEEQDRIGDEAPQATSPLAPATVNIRLTALRQFLAHCSLWGYLPDLAPERVRAALRRLRIERRRPYQILAEPEWTDFLRAARAPGEVAGAASPGAARQGDVDDDAAPDATAAAPDAELAEQWWGVPRAARQRAEAERKASESSGAMKPSSPQAPLSRAIAEDERGTRMARSRAGLTGARTAQRDHALLALALATGLRAIELCALDLGDLAREWNAGREEWWLVLPDAKTKGQRGGRTLPLAPALVATLLAYAAATGRQWARADDRATPLFLSRHGGTGGERQLPPQRGEQAAARERRRLSPQQVRRIVDRVETQWLAAQYGSAEGAGGFSDARAISPHALRHSTAVALLEGNERSQRAPASVEHVRGWLGHFDIRTTQGYLAHLDARRHRRPFVLQPGEDAATPTEDTQMGKHEG